LNALIARHETLRSGFIERRRPAVADHIGAPRGDVAARRPDVEGQESERESRSPNTRRRGGTASLRPDTASALSRAAPCVWPQTIMCW
jgi:hypothetical protein